MWFETFLKGRYQYATIKEYSSVKLMSTYGVPQRSVFGPFMQVTTCIKRSYIAPYTSLQTAATFY